MSDNYKNSLNNHTGTSTDYPDDDALGILQWLNPESSVKQSPKVFTPVQNGNTENRISEARQKLSEWRRNQNSLQNNVNIQVVTQSIESSETPEPEITNKPVKPWNNIPFQEKTKITATAQLCLRYMLQSNKKPLK